MAAALRIGLWRHNKKHKYCLILRRVQVHACITLCVQVVKRIWQSKPASETIPKRETLLLAIGQSRQILGFPSGTFSLWDWAMWTSAPKTRALKWYCSNQSPPVPQAVWGSVGVTTTLYSYCVTNTHWQHGEGESFDFMFPKPPIINSCIEPMCLQSSQRQLSMILYVVPGETVQLTGSGRYLNAAVTFHEIML